MYAFFEIAGSRAARTAAAAAGSLIITAVLMATAIVPASPTANLTIGVLA